MKRLIKGLRWIGTFPADLIGMIFVAAGRLFFSYLHRNPSNGRNRD